MQVILNRVMWILLNCDRYTPVGTMPSTLHFLNMEQMIEEGKFDIVIQDNE